MRATVTLDEYIRSHGTPAVGTIITVEREDTGEPIKRAFHHTEGKMCYYTEVQHPLSYSHPDKTSVPAIFKTENYWVSLSVHVPDEPKPNRETLTEHQFHVVWTEAVGRTGYDKNLFKEVLQALKDKKLITR